MGLRPVFGTYINEGQGDYLRVGELMCWERAVSAQILRAHAEVADFAGVPVVALELVDDRFYHSGHRAGRSRRRVGVVLAGGLLRTLSSRRTLEELFPDAVMADEQDAAGWGLNAFFRRPSGGDGARQAPRLAAMFSERGFAPTLVDVSELQKAGGSVKCCTLEVPC